MSEKKTESAPAKVEQQLKGPNTVDKQNEQLAKLSKELEQANADREKLTAEVADLRLKVNTLEALLVEEAKQTDGDHVILDGDRCEITHRMGVKDFFEAIRRHEIPEDHTVVAVNVKA